MFDVLKSTFAVLNERMTDAISSFMMFCCFSGTTVLEPSCTSTGHPYLSDYFWSTSSGEQTEM